VTASPGAPPEDEPPPGEPPPGEPPENRPPGDRVVTDRPVGGEGVPAAAFVVGLLGAAGFVLTYLFGANTQLLGIMVFLMMGGIGVGMVSWAKRFLTPREPDVEPRGRIESTEEEIRRFSADFNVGEYELERRSLLTKLLLGALGAMGLAAVVPFASLGPKPDESFSRTRWKRGTRLVDIDGTPIRAGSVNTDAVLTVFPDGDVGDEFAQALLIGLQPGRLVPVPGREDWTPGNMAAFSKICTHVGCPVGLYERQTGELLCPCHQSTFAVYEACEPIFGPAATPLPQLPLAIDDDGFVIARGDFSRPPGPEFWNQRRLGDG
jgi:ubiquinol-cytochrome c reductase iron-sulfur subunit